MISSSCLTSLIIVSLVSIGCGTTVTLRLEPVGPQNLDTMACPRAALGRSGRNWISVAWEMPTRGRVKATAPTMILHLTRGKHTVKTGFSYIKMQANAFSNTYQSSKLSFNAGTTSLPGPWYNDGCTPGGACPGIGAAVFLLGDVSTGLAGVTTAEVADRMARYAGYVQDDFKATPKLTFNLGLRYDLMLPTVDAHNVKSWMDPTVTNPGAGNLKGALVFATPGRRAPA